MILYHLAPRKAQWYIHMHGLLTRRSRGKQPVVWLCERRIVPWVLAHISERDELSPADYIVIRIETDKAKPFGGLIPGRYVVSEDIPPTSLTLVSINALEWLAQAKAQRKKRQPGKSDCDSGK